MRALAQPAVLKSASVAACVSALACAPRLILWPARSLPVWYLELTVLLTGFFLWSFVFGWHCRYTGRDPLPPPRSPVLWSVATACGVAAAGLDHWCFDPTLRVLSPAEYPTSFAAWLAMVLFSLSFGQLFVLYAPLAFFLRLVGRRWPGGAGDSPDRVWGQTTLRSWLAAALTVAFAVFVMSLKVASAKSPPTPAVLAELVAVRVLSATLLVVFYLKGGLPLAWWISLVAQARLLLDL